MKEGISGAAAVGGKCLSVLHTSDWHLGHLLCGRKRYHEAAAFLKWLAALVAEKDIDILLIAGDIFDTPTPGVRAQELYYRFLHEVALPGMRHIVITGGNHDSPLFLDAPRQLLGSRGVHVVGSARENPEGEVLVLRDGGENPVAIVCAVPYLRDRDVRLSRPGEDAADKEARLAEGIRAHYAATGEAAARLQAEIGKNVPIIGMGHLFAGGGDDRGEGVRELYVGSLGQVGTDIFPACFDYVALGHLHTPQNVQSGKTVIRYSGSPLALGFGDAGRNRSVSLACIEESRVSVEARAVPVFQRLERISGDWEAISRRLDFLKREAGGCDGEIWLEIVHEGAEIVGDLRERVEQAVAGAPLEVLRIRNAAALGESLREEYEGETLAALEPEEVFERCLDAAGIPQEQHLRLMLAYREVLQSLQEEDDQVEGNR